MTILYCLDQFLGHLFGDLWQDPLAIDTDLKSVTNSELLNLAVLSQKSHYFSIFGIDLL